MTNGDAAEYPKLTRFTRQLMTGVFEVPTLSDTYLNDCFNNTPRTFTINVT